MYIADNPAKDFITPEKMGWNTVRVRRREGIYSSIEPATGAAPDIEVPHLDKLSALLASTGLPTTRTARVGSLLA